MHFPDSPIRVRIGHLAMAAAIAASLPAAACSSSALVPERGPDVAQGGGIVAGALTARATVTGIALKNQTEHPVAYRVTERNFLARVLYGPPCTGGPACRVLAQGAETLFPWEQADGYEPGAREYVLGWWRIVPDGRGGSVAGSQQSTAVTR